MYGFFSKTQAPKFQNSSWFLAKLKHFFHKNSTKPEKVNFSKKKTLNFSANKRFNCLVYSLEKIKICIKTSTICKKKLQWLCLKTQRNLATTQYFGNLEIPSCRQTGQAKGMFTCYQLNIWLQWAMYANTSSRKCCSLRHVNDEGVNFKESKMESRIDIEEKWKCIHLHELAYKVIITVIVNFLHIEGSKPKIIVQVQEFVIQTSHLWFNRAT